MNSVLIAVLTFGCVFGGSLAGLATRGKLPAHHQIEETRDAVKLVMGLIASMSALVLSLLISSAHTSYDRQESDVQQLATHIMQLDRILARYGQEAAESRARLRSLSEAELSRLWPNAARARVDLSVLSTRGSVEELFDSVGALAPKTELQRFERGRALDLMISMGNTRRLLNEQSGGALSWPFLVVVVSWLVALFFGFGLLSRRNATVVTAFFVGALTVAGAIFLILEMNRPFTGWMQISSAPMRQALEQIAR